MIKRVLVFFTIIILFAMPFTARADVVMGNEFLRKHEKETEIIDRQRFYANGPNGIISLKEAPGSKKEITTYPNGTELLIARIYNHNGQYWGITPVGHGYWNTGWIPMDQLLVLYTREDFEAEHMNEFYTYTGSYNASLTAEKLVVWEWPGSDRAKCIIDYDSFIGVSTSGYNSGTSKGLVIKDIVASHAYRDEEGREWGFAEIKYAYTSWAENDPERYRLMWEWICLSDPQNSNIPSFNPAPTAIKWTPDGNPDWMPESNFNILALIVILLLAVSAGTVVIIKIFWKRKNNNV